MNFSLVYSVLSILPFDAVKYEMLSALSNKRRKPILSHATSIELQWINLV